MLLLARRIARESPQWVLSAMLRHASKIPKFFLPTSVWASSTSCVAVCRDVSLIKKRADVYFRRVQLLSGLLSRVSII